MSFGLQPLPSWMLPVLGVVLLLVDFREIIGTVGSLARLSPTQSAPGEYYIYPPWAA